MADEEDVIKPIVGVVALGILAVSSIVAGVGKHKHTLKHKEIGKDVYEANNLSLEKILNSDNNDDSSKID